MCGGQRVTSVVGWDIETTSLCGYDEGASIISWACFTAEHGGVTQWMHDVKMEYPMPPRFRPSHTLTGHNLFFDVGYWESQGGAPVEAAFFDTMVAHAFIDETAPNTLGDVAHKYLGYGKVEGLDRRKLLEYPLDEVLEYNLQDAKLAYELYAPLKEELEKLNLVRTFDLRMQALRVLIDMHHNGVGVDLDEVERQVTLARAKLATTTRLLRETCGEVNPNSPTQLRKVLYKDMRLPVLNTTKTGEPSTDKATLDALLLHGDSVAQRAISLLKEHRELAKLAGTYLEPLKDHVGRDGRVHPSYHLARGADFGRGKGTRFRSFGTVTGRLSSSNPNFQNVSKDERIRRCFVPRPGYKLLDADYAQIEVRVAAWLSGDPALLQMIRDGRDYHTHTLALIEGRDYDEVLQLVKTSAMWKTKRDTVKRVNFGILYGAYPPKIKEQIEATGVNVSMREVNRMWYGWKETYATYVAWETLVQREALEQGEVVSPLGGRRRFGEGVDRSRASRQASNFLIQGTAADVMLLGLVALPGCLPNEARVIATVHDSVTLEYTDEADPDALPEAVRVALVEEPFEQLYEIEGVQRLEDLYLEVDIELGKERWLK